MYRIPAQIIGLVIPETCSAIAEVLQEYMKVGLVHVMIVYRIVNPFPGCSLAPGNADRTRSRAKSLCRLCVWTWGVSLPLAVPRYS